MSRRTFLAALCLVALLTLAGCSAEVDLDNDGLNRTFENQHGLNDFSADSDGDGLDDGREVGAASLNASTPDTDGDHLNDSQELAFGSNPAKTDTDQDGLGDRGERQFETNATLTDTDGDGLRDGHEVKLGISPARRDTDGDNLADNTEVENDSTNPSAPDTDGDDLEDGRELQIGTAPNRPDTDGDGLDDGTEQRSKSDSLTADTEGDGLNDGTESRIGTDPTAADTDGGNRSDAMEHEAANLNPAKQEIRVQQSPDAGWETKAIRRKTLNSVEFLAALPRNRTKRNRTVTAAATKLCNAHDRVVPNQLANATGTGQEAYRNTYRVAHAAETLHDLGANIDVSTINRRMRMAREYGTMASKYAPVFGSYQRLHNASCAVKRGEPGAKEDFYIAAAEFAVDLALAQQGVVYEASFKTTGMAARTLGMNRLARVGGYKCVGLVESELHWLFRETYSGALDAVSKEAIAGNLTVDGWNPTVRREVGRYIGNKTDTALVGRRLVPETKVMTCITENLNVETLWKQREQLSKQAFDTLRVILSKQRLPENSDLSFLRKVDSVNRCLAG